MGYLVANFRIECELYVRVGLLKIVNDVYNQKLT
jgi:hypothetical protein